MVPERLKKLLRVKGKQVKILYGLATVIWKSGYAKLFEREWAATDKSREGIRKKNSISQETCHL